MKTKKTKEVLLIEIDEHKARYLQLLADNETLAKQRDKLNGECAESAMHHVNALTTIDEIYEAVTGAKRNGLRAGIIDHCREIRNQRDQLKEISAKQREEVRHERDNGFALSNRLQQRVLHLGNLRHVWSKYLAAQAVGAPADSLEELRIAAFGQLVALLEMSTDEPLLTRAEMGICVGDNGPAYRREANLARVANRYTEL